MNEVKNKPSICFIDSNIWLYAFIETPQKEDKRKRQIAKKTIQENDVIISIQVINETCINLLQKTDKTEKEIQALILSFYNKYTVVEIDKSILIKASQLREKYSLSFWDSIIVSTALSSDCEILYSKDMQVGLEVEEKLKIVNPFKSDNGEDEDS